MESIAVRRAAELPVVLDRHSGIALPVQLAAALREAIDHGTMRPGELLPATRGFAARLGVARGVVVAAYEQLIAEGYLRAGHGRGTLVDPQLESVAAHAPVATSAAQAPRSGGIGDPLGVPEPGSAAADRHRAVSAVPTAGGGSGAAAPTAGGDSGAAAPPLSVGAPDTETVATPAWRAAWRRAVARAHLEAPELGDPRLREEIADHLRRMRGTHRPAHDVIITAGARDGLNLLLTALAARHGRALTVGVEDPGFPSLRRVAAMHSAHIVPVHVDADGLDPHALPARGLDAVIVTPSHQYPLGGSLPLTRRRELLAWAEASGAVLIEDDYDSELRHAGSPLPALAALDDPENGSVALLGTFSKTVSPALSAGFLLAPLRVRELVEPVRHELGGSVSAVVQSALAEYLASGELRRHTARMRRRYAFRRALVVERLAGIPGMRVRPMSGGLHAVLEFTGEHAAARESSVHAALQAAGLGGVPLSAYWQRRGASHDERFGLVIGTGRARSEEFAAALNRLSEILCTET